MEEFKFVLNDQPNHTTFFCNTAQHIVIVNPQNHYAHEEYGVRLEPCNCTQEQKDKRRDFVPVQEPQSHAEFEALGQERGIPQDGGVWSGTSTTTPRGMKTTYESEQPGFTHAPELFVETKP